MVWSVGVDLGATNLRIAIAGASGEVIAERRLPTTQGPDGDAITAALLEAVGSLCLEVGLTAEEIVGVGIATFGPLDMQQGAVVTPRTWLTPSSRSTSSHPSAVSTPRLRCTC
jgi:Transcriptional regulator/sugar kinase